VIVVVASSNPVKVRAVESAFAAVFPSEAFEFVSVDVESGVSDQPVSDEETRRGAVNRVHAARDTAPDGAFWVGLEGGIERIDGELMASAWMAVLGRGGKLGLSRTTGLPLPPKVREYIDQGMELGEANDRVFDTVNSKQAGGAFGLLTNGRMTRESIYAQTLELALLPFASELYPHE